MITETTITAFAGYDPAGIPEFVRARKAMQYSSSIDDFARIMKEGNNGGYANDWLVADRKTNEIASLELGLKNVTLERKKDGYFVGANFPINPKLAREETTFEMKDMGLSANARRIRWEQLMAENKGKDRRRRSAAVPRRPLRHLPEEGRAERADPLRSHRSVAARMGDWQPPYGIAGAVQNKVADACDGRAYVFHRRRGSCLRHALQGCGAFESPPRVQLAEGISQGHAVLPMDSIRDCPVDKGALECGDAGGSAALFGWYLSRNSLSNPQRRLH